MRAVDKLIAHWAATRLKRWRFKLPDIDLTVYWGPWTLGEKDQVFGTDPRLRQRTFLDIVMVKAQDGEGKPLFQGDVERDELASMVDPAVVERLGHKIMACLDADLVAAADEEGAEGPKA